MHYFLYVLGILSWLYAFSSLLSIQTVFQETTLLLVTINGTLMIVGGAIIGSIKDLEQKSAVGALIKPDPASISTNTESSEQGQKTVGNTSIVDGGAKDSATNASTDTIQTAGADHGKTGLLISATLILALVVATLAIVFYGEKQSDPSVEEVVTDTYPPRVTGSLQIDTLIAEFNAADTACSTGDNDACIKRDKEIGRRLNAIGWCSGNQGQSESEYSWHLCDKKSRRF
jgi:hypothetical protein